MIKHSYIVSSDTDTELMCLGFSTRLHLTAIPSTQATTACRLSVMRMFLHSIAYCGSTRRRLGTISLAAGGVHIGCVVIHPGGSSSVQVQMF